MKTRTVITQELANKLLNYDPDTGFLTWKSRDPEMFKTAWRSRERAAQIWNTRFAGKEAFVHLDPAGYKTGGINYTSIRAHRLIWIMVYNEIPEEIDHINGNKADNRLANLRAVTKSGNQRNCKLRSDNTSGYQGVCKTPYGTWDARICERHLGTFPTKEAAIAARQAAEQELGYGDRHME